MSGIRITGFELIEKVGEGGMGQVWKARQLSLDRIVAIKLLSERYGKDPDSVRQIFQEARTAAKLKHLGIVQVYDASEEHGNFYFVMEFVDGLSVGQWIRRKSVLPVADALLVVESVVEALDYAWQTAGLIHCDLKPENLMVEKDGTIKVADLGLSRTRDSESSESSDEVVGTPGYISPEQVEGERDLDCRTDIYALGCILYHMITGCRPFMELSDEDAMVAQMTQQIPDPRDLVPTIPPAVSCLLERMLAKDRDQRPSGWDQVREDIAKVTKGRLPYAEALPEGASTIKLGKTWVGHEPEVKPPPSAKAVPRRSMLVPFGVAAAILAAVVAAAIFMTGNTPPPPVEPPQVARQQPIAPPPKAEGPDAATLRAGEMYEFAKAWAGKNPRQYAEALARFRKVLEQTSGSKYSLMAEDDIKALETARDGAVAAVMARLKGQTSGLAGKGKYDEAVAVVESYAGPLAAESRGERMAEVRALRLLKQQADEEKQKAEVLGREKLEKTVESVVDKLLKDGLVPAHDLVAAAMQDKEMASSRSELSDLAGVLNAAIDIDTKILNSFEEQKGKEVAVQLNTGNQTFVIKAVQGGKITGTQRSEVGESVITTGQTFGLDALAPEERLKRMGNDSQPEVALVKGLMAWSSRNALYARQYFGATHPILASRLTAKVEEMNRKKNEEEAQKALAALKNEEKPAVQPGPQPGQEPAAPPPLPRELAAIRDDFEAVNKLFLKKNRQLNDFEVIPQRNGEGQVYGVQVEGIGVEDVSPLAAYSGFTSLSFRFNPSSDQKGLLRDLTPLKYLRFDTLIIQGHPVWDLTPLRAIPTLRTLEVSNTGVRDLVALKGLGLVSLNVSGTRVYDCAPLVGAPLKQLDISGTQVKNIAFVKQMPLNSLNISNTKVYDFSPLADLPLKSLKMSGTQLKTLDLLKKMDLVELEISNTGVSDLTPVAGQKIGRLDLSGCLVKDFSVLAGWPLTSVNLARSKILNLECLKGKDLTWIDISGTSVSDLSQIRDLSTLEYLNISQTRVRGLGSLKGMPIRSLVVDISTMDEVNWLVDNLPKLERLNWISLEGEWRRTFRERLNERLRPPNRHRTR
jgi:serine/threonine-protein kinase